MVKLLGRPSVPMLFAKQSFGFIVAAVLASIKFRIPVWFHVAVSGSRFIAEERKKNPARVHKLFFSSIKEGLMLGISIVYYLSNYFLNNK